VKTTFIYILFFTFYFAQAQKEKIPRKATKLFEEYKEAKFNNNYVKGIILLNEALEIAPDYLDAHRELGSYYREVKDYKKAFKHFSHIVKKHPKTGSTPVYIAGEMAYLSAEYDSALVYLERYMSKGNLIFSMKEKGLRYLDNIKFAIKSKANPVKFDPENLGPNINTALLEYLPAISADNETLVFTRRLKTGGHFNEDFFHSSWDGKNWRKAKNLGSPVNTFYNEGAHSISANGKYIYFTRCDDGSMKREGYGSCDIYRTSRRGEHWVKPKNMGRAINTEKWESQPCMSADGQTLYFTSNRNGGFGGKDIWFIRIVDGMWSDPINLGPQINSPGNEESPYIHPDGQTLYFSSDHHTGLGDYDFFLSRKNEKAEWGKPLNFGYPVNSSGFELGIYISTNGKYGYFASDRFEGFGGLDIYRFELDDKLKPGPVTYVKGKIVDADTKRPIKAKVELIDLDINETSVMTYSDELNGEYLVCIPAGKLYALNVSRKKYLFHSESFSLKEYKETKPYNVNVKLKPIKEGSAVVLKNIFFETGSFELKIWSRTELDKLTAFLMENESVKIEISGHTDNQGGEELNQKLSENRAKSVKEYLLNNSIVSTRLVYKGYGESKPIDSNETDEGRANNRRTEFKILEVGQ